GAMYPVARFKLSGSIGEHTLTSNAGNLVTRAFCPKCGSPILGRNNAMEGFVTISLGTFDDSSVFEPAVVIFARNRKPWDSVDRSRREFEAEAEWHPQDAA